MNDPTTSRLVSQRLDFLKSGIRSVWTDVNPLEQPFKVDGNELVVGRFPVRGRETRRPGFLRYRSDNADFALSDEFGA